MMGIIWVLMAGLPATGKSTLAQRLASQLDRCVVLDKDRVRAALFPGPMTDYSSEQDTLCMQAILEAATYMTRHSLADYIIFDGRTFSKKAQIDEVVSAADAAGAAWRILHLACSDEVAESRLNATGSHHPAANRDVALYYRVKANFEPILCDKLDLDTTGEIEPLVSRALAYLRT